MITTNPLTKWKSYLDKIKFYKYHFGVTSLTPKMIDAIKSDVSVRDHVDLDNLTPCTKEEYEDIMKDFNYVHYTDILNVVFLNHCIESKVPDPNVPAHRYLLAMSYRESLLKRTSLESVDVDRLNIDVEKLTFPELAHYHYNPGGKGFIRDMVEKWLKPLPLMIQNQICAVAVRVYHEDLDHIFLESVEFEKVFGEHTLLTKMFFKLPGAVSYLSALEGDMYLKEPQGSLGALFKKIDEELRIKHYTNHY